LRVTILASSFGFLAFTALSPIWFLTALTALTAHCFNFRTRLLTGKLAGLNCGTNSGHLGTHVTSATLLIAFSTLPTFALNLR
jgi:hypothetical protein